MSRGEALCTLDNLEFRGARIVAEIIFNKGPGKLNLN
jgi:hypothetical protein